MKHFHIMSFTENLAAGSAGKPAVEAPLLDIKGFSAAAALAVYW